MTHSGGHGLCALPPRIATCHIGTSKDIVRNVLYSCTCGTNTILRGRLVSTIVPQQLDRRGVFAVSLHDPDGATHSLPIFNAAAGIALIIHIMYAIFCLYASSLSDLELLGNSAHNCFWFMLPPFLRTSSLGDVHHWQA